MDNSLIVLGKLVARYLVIPIVLGVSWLVAMPILKWIGRIFNDFSRIKNANNIVLFIVIAMIAVIVVIIFFWVASL